MLMLNVSPHWKEESDTLVTLRVSVGPPQLANPSVCWLFDAPKSAKLLKIA